MLSCFNWKRLKKHSDFWLIADHRRGDIEWEYTGLLEAAGCEIPLSMGKISDGPNIEQDAVEHSLDGSKPAYDASRPALSVMSFVHQC